MKKDNKVRTSGHGRSGLLNNPYLIALSYAMCYVPLSFIIDGIKPLSRPLRDLNKSMWEQLPVISMLFPYQQSKIPLWVSEYSSIWTAVVMGLLLIIIIRWCKWIGVVLAPIIASTSILLYQRILFEHYYKRVGFFTFEQSDLWLIHIILAGFAAGILLGLFCMILVQSVKKLPWRYVRLWSRP